MRYKELISEIRKMSQSDFQLDKSDFPKYGPLAKKSQPLPGNSGLVYYIDHFGPDLRIVISDPDTQESIGQLLLRRNRRFPMPNSHTVEMIAVDPDRRGQGISKSLYGIYLSILKYPLLAGYDQTPGGRRNWVSLSKIPGVIVRGYVAVSDNYFDQDSTRPGYVEKKFKMLIDNLMNMGGEYLGRTENVHFFVFDVEPGSGELEPVVKRQLKLYGYHDLVNPGLFAVWTGK